MHSINPKQYLLIKSKTFSNFISGIPNSITFLKALVIGETKVLNGETYVVKMTPSGNPDWRKADSKDSASDDDSNDLNELFDNAWFPEMSEIEVVPNVTLGGSTGATLVKNKTTDEQFVMKKGASKAHVEEEFLTNSIYKLMGVEVPNMKLYQTVNSSFILSHYMENTSVANNVMDDLMKEDITANFVLDCLLANWDIYKNDNILVNDDNGLPVRVDNGGGLRFSATGRNKGANFSGNVDELVSMIKNNKNVTSLLTQDRINEQIEDILLRKDEILDLIQDTDLKDVMSLRLQYLQNHIVSPLAPPKKKIANQYKKITDKQLEKAYQNVGNDITKYDYKNGWLFLNEIAKLRGFDDIPEILADKEFEKEMKKDGNILVHRGLTGGNGKTAKDYMNDFVSEDCFFGTVGMYGAGIYAAVNSEKGNYTQSNPNYETALSYASYEKEHIMDLIIPKSAKVIDANELDNMMSEEFFGKEFKEKKAELDEEVRNLYDMKKKIEDFGKVIELDVKKNMGWNEKTHKILLNSRPDRVYADTDKFPFSKALNYFTALVESINGKIEKIDDLNYEVSLPNSREKFILNSHSAEIALKQKNQFSTPYNFHYQRMREFIIKNHYRNIESKVNEAIDEAKSTSDEIKQFKQSLSDSEKKVSLISEEVNKLKDSGSTTLNTVMAKVASRPNGEYRGFYAAIKGYDVILQKNAWGDKNKTFAVILNRSKMIVKNFE